MSDDTNQHNTPKHRQADDTRGLPEDEEQVHTDVTHLVRDAQDAFDMGSWGHPENEPSPPPKEQSDHVEIHEAVEHEPQQEVSDYIQQKKETPDIDEEAAKHGLEAVPQPVQYPKHKTVKVPLSDDKILQGKKMPMDTSFRWLAEFCLYLLHKAHIRLKVAHGKATRIFEK